MVVVHYWITTELRAVWRPWGNKALNTHLEGGTSLHHNTPIENDSGPHIDTSAFSTFRSSPEFIHKCQTGNNSSLVKKLFSHRKKVLSYLSTADQCGRAYMLEFACFNWNINVIDRMLCCIFVADDTGWCDPFYFINTLSKLGKDDNVTV